MLYTTFFSVLAAFTQQSYFQKLCIKNIIFKVNHRESELDIIKENGLKPTI